MKQQSYQVLVRTTSGKVCKLCGRLRPFGEYVWTDSSGRVGVTARCERCRARGPHRPEGAPQARFPITRHAIYRYVQRVNPTLERIPHEKRVLVARHEMSALMADAPWHDEWPDWLSGRRPHGDVGRNAPGHLRIGEDVIFVLAKRRKFGRGVKAPRGGYTEPGKVVVTVLVKGWRGDDLD